MKAIQCPACGSAKVYHYTDAYVVRVPVLNGSRKLELLDADTNEYDENFFECCDCGYQPKEAELTGDVPGTRTTVA